MDAKKVAVRAGQVCLLLVAASLLFHWWKSRPPVIVSDDQVEDLIEQVGDTYVPVQAGVIERGTLRQYVTAYGTIEPAGAVAGREAASASISSPNAARVASVACFEGQSVKKGDVLFRLDSTPADAAVGQGQKMLAADQAAVDAMAKIEPATQPWREVNARWQLAADQAGLERLRAQNALLAVVAPIDGTITHVGIAAGETVDPRKAAVEIVDLDRLVASVDVTVDDLAKLHAGQAAEIEVRSGSEMGGPTTQPTSIAGTVVLVDSAIDPATGMGSADIAVPAGGGLRPGEFIRAAITVGEETNRLFVPTQAITQNQYGESAVGEIQTDGRWAWLVAVKTGWRDGNKIEIAGDGLVAGQEIVTGGANGLVQRTRLKLLKD